MILSIHSYLMTTKYLFLIMTNIEFAKTVMALAKAVTMGQHAKLVAEQVKHER